MRSFEIFVEPESPGTREARSALESPEDAAIPLTAPFARAAREVLDVFIHGANVTARVSERHSACVLRDLGLAVSELARSPRGKRIVRFYDEAWELCLERLGETACLSVYRAGGEPSVFVYDRPVVFAEVHASVREAIDAALERPSTSRLFMHELTHVREALSEPPCAPAPSPIPDPSPVVIEIDRGAPIAIAAEFTMRAGEAAVSEPSLERADLHALLFRGRMRAEIRGREVDLGEGYPFLFAERFIDLSRRTLDAWERGQAHHVRCEAGNLYLGVRLGADGPLSLILGEVRRQGKTGRLERAIYTFPALSVFDVVEAALAFGRALVRAILRRDRGNGNNLRLSALRRQLRETSDALREVKRQDVKVNGAPESYRAFALSAKSRTLGAPEAAPLSSRLRYSERWRALVPGIDLRSTFLCGDRLVIGGALETFCLNRATGEVLWRIPTERATSVVTPGGIARLSPDGELRVHDFGTGDVTLRTWLAPRLGGPSAGAVVSAAGLPRLLILTEGERHLVAIDLTSGEARWRFAWGRRGALRLKRFGKLLYVASGDSGLTALDVLTGAIVWRVRDRLRFRTAPTLDHDLLFTIAGGVNSKTNLYGIDPYSGSVRFTREVDAFGAVAGAQGACTVEGSPLIAGSVVAVAVRDRHGLRLIAFDRDTGAVRWASPTQVAPIGTSWLAVDDLFIGNTPTGELVAIEAELGNIRYRLVLGRPLESDTPRRLEPVLRSGALFVPQSDVHVLSPRDGTPLATIGPCDAIPDLLRVDERCDVYVAEESGHMVSFGAGPRLSLVR